MAVDTAVKILAELEKPSDRLWLDGEAQEFGLVPPLPPALRIECPCDKPVDKFKLAVVPYAGLALPDGRFKAVKGLIAPLQVFCSLVAWVTLWEGVRS